MEGQPRRDDHRVAGLDPAGGEGRRHRTPLQILGAVHGRDDQRDGARNDGQTARRRLVGRDREQRLVRPVAGDLEGRAAAWAATARIIGDFPLTGTGFGTYREVSTRYAPAGSPKRFVRAHNDYIEVVAEGGWVTASLIAWLTVGFGILASRRLWRNNGSLSVSRLGLALGLASLALHAVVDFNHQIPANALLFVALAALLVTSPVVSSQERHAA